VTSTRRKKERERETKREKERDRCDRHDGTMHQTPRTLEGTDTEKRHKTILNLKYVLKIQVQGGWVLQGVVHRRVCVCVCVRACAFACVYLCLCVCLRAVWKVMSVLRVRVCVCVCDEG